MQVNELLDRLVEVRPTGSGWAALCPAHDDTIASLTIAEGTEQPVVLHCHAGCTPDAVMKALGLDLGDLNGQPRIVASYPYTDLDGNLLYVVHRWSPKSFTVEPTGITDAQRVLYQRPAIEYARSLGIPLYLVEGEKDVETLRDRSLPATTAPHGAQSAWLPQYTDTLRGCNVVIVADNDKAGIERGRRVFAELQGKAATVSLVKPAYGNDITDLFNAGYGTEQLEPISEQHDGITSIKASEVNVRRINWAWQDFVPFGSMTLIDGDPGSAKSTLTVDLVARWTSGAPMPDGEDHAGPHDAVMVSAEDDPEATIVPRLLRAGANLDRVHLVTGGIREDLPFNLGVDTFALRELVITTKSRYVVLDPLSAFMPQATDSKMDQSVRTALAPLQHMARQLGFALVVVRHLTKGGTHALYAGSGSVGYIASARSAYIVTKDPMSENRVLAPTKSNLARLPTALAYTVESSPDDPEVPIIEWHGEVDWTAQRLLDRQRGVKTPADDTDLIKEAKDWLRSTVTPYCLNGGVGMKWKSIVSQAKDEGEYSEHTLRRARDGVLRKHYNPSFLGEVQIGCYWIVLPYDDATAAAAREQLPNLPENNEPYVDPPSMKTGQAGQVAASGSTPADPEPRTEDWLMAQPLVCDIPNCPATGTACTRWAEPYWTIRCWNHRPDLHPDPEDGDA